MRAGLAVGMGLRGPRSSFGVRRNTVLAHASEAAENLGLKGVILRSERDESAAAQASAGPKDRLTDVTRLWRGSVTMLEVTVQRL
jgi:hypothetical protein